MNSETPSSELEIPQDGLSTNDSNEHSVTSETSKEALNPDEPVDNSQVEPQLNNDSINSANDQSSTKSDPIKKVLDTFPSNIPSFIFS